jgi:ABC-type uncharacterized transport system substrate-binding protein
MAPPGGRSGLGAADWSHRRQVDLRQRTPPAARVARATFCHVHITTNPIVFGNGGDRLQRGVASLNRPGGNVTGITSMSGELVGKRLAPLRDLLPKAAYFGVLTNLKIAPFNGPFIRGVQAAASVIGCLIEVLTANTSDEIDSVFVIAISTLLALIGIERRHFSGTVNP